VFRLRGIDSIHSVQHLPMQVIETSDLFLLGTEPFVQLIDLLCGQLVMSHSSCERILTRNMAKFLSDIVLLLIRSVFPLLHLLTNSRKLSADTSPRTQRRGGEMGESEIARGGD
jgi:hypothetical protein